MSSSPSSIPPSPESGSAGSRLRNGAIAIAAIILSVVLFLGVNNPSASNTLSALAASATPLTVAEQNGKPTLMEFYADWCTSCQAMAKDLSELKQTYSDRLNFVMLNVDNTKWLAEMADYRVDGIPHFVFLDGEGKAVANAIGEQPRTVLAANLEALSQRQPLPYLARQGETSGLEAPSRTTALDDTANDDPRNHGG